MTPDLPGVAQAAGELATQAVTAAAGKTPDPVSVKGWTITGAGVWTLVVLGFIHTAKGLIEKLPDLYARWIERDGQLRSEKMSKSKTTGDRLLALEERVQSMSTAMAFIANAVTTATNALDDESHEARLRAKRQALEMVGMAAATLGKDDPFVIALRRITHATGDVTAPL